MARPSEEAKQKMARRILMETIYSRIDAKERLSDILQAEYRELDQYEIADLSEEFFPKVWDRIIRIYNEHQRNGVLPCAKPSELIEHHLIGSGIPQISDNSRIKIVRKRLEARLAVYNTIKDLDARDFEKLAGAVQLLQCCSSVLIGKKSHDKGIDFIGHLQIDSPMFYPGLSRPTKIWLLGQTKHESTPASADPIQSFTTVAQQFASGDQYFSRIIAPFRYEPTEPIMKIFISTSGFSKDAKYYLKTGRIVGRTLVNLVEDITWLGNRFFDDSRPRSVFLLEDFIGFVRDLPRQKYITKAIFN